MESNTPGSYYQPLFDLLNQEHGIIPLESEMTDIIVVVEKMCGKQPGPRWVKASERLPQSHEALYIKIEKGKSIGSWHPHHDMFVDDAGDFHPADQVEWLDESAAGREDAVMFAEWALREGWETSHDRKGWMKHSNETPYVLTTAELYELFKQQKEK